MSEIIARLVKKYEAGQMTRRDLIVSLSALVMAPPRTMAQSRSPTIPVSTLNHVTLSVADVQRSVEFYQGLFGMPMLTSQGPDPELEAATSPSLTIGTGPQALGFFEGGSQVPPSIHHFCLGVERFDVDQTLKTLADHGVEGRVRMRDGEVPEVMFSDPDNLSVQIQDVSYCGGGWLTRQPVPPNRSPPRRLRRPARSDLHGYCGGVFCPLKARPANTVGLGPRRPAACSSVHRPRSSIN